MNTVDKSTLQQIFQSIENSPTPELELRYLTEEFNFRTDELFLLYSDYKKKSDCATQQKQGFLWNRLGLSSAIGSLNRQLLATPANLANWFSHNLPDLPVMNSSEVVTVERRKSSPQARLRYGLLKLLNEVNGVESFEKFKISFNSALEEGIMTELSRYKFRKNNSERPITTREVLREINLSELDLSNLNSFVDSLIEYISKNFEVFYPPRSV